MVGIAAGLAGSIGIALVITALTLPNRKSAQVINAVANGTANVIEASLGIR